VTIQRTVTVPASGILVVMVVASVFYCVAAERAIQVQPDEGVAVDISTGKGFGTSGGKRFNKLVFKNTNIVAVVVNFYAGDEPYSGPTNVTEAGTIVVRGDTPILVLLGSADCVVDIPNGQKVQLVGNRDFGSINRNRKYFEVDNNSANALDVFNDAETIRFARVLGGTSRRFELSDTVKLINNSGGALKISCYEVF